MIRETGEIEGQAAQRGLVALEHFDAREPEVPGGEGAGLVQRDHVDPGEVLQGPRRPGRGRRAGHPPRWPKGCPKGMLRTRAQGEATTRRVMAR